MNNSFFVILSFLIGGCFIYFIMRFFIAILGMNRAIGQGNKQAKLVRINRQEELKNMSADSLLNLLKNDSYLNGLKGTIALRNFFKCIENNQEKEIAKNFTEKTLYSLLVDAEHETGHKGRPEAIDNVWEIWDILKELSMREGREKGAD